MKRSLLRPSRSFPRASLAVVMCLTLLATTGCPPVEDGDPNGLPILPDPPADPDTRGLEGDVDSRGRGDPQIITPLPDDDADSDGDGVPDDVDLCPDRPNPDQLDRNGDGLGDACEDTIVAMAVGEAGRFLYRMSLSGDRIEALPIVPTQYPNGFSMTPDGQTIAFIGSSNLFIHRFGDLAPTQVTDFDPAVDFVGQPRISANGSHIVFNHLDRTDPEATQSLYSLDLATGEVIELASASHQLTAWDVSPDGRWVAFSKAVTETNSEILVVRIDGTDLRNVSRHAGGDYNPVFSPDGRVNYNSYRNGAQTVMSVTVNGTGERELTFGLRPRFSPDGGMIVVSSHDAATNRMELLLTPASGGGRTRLTKEDSPQVRDSDYAFSADGSYIAYIGGFDLEAYQNPQLFVIPTDGSAPARRIELPEGLRVVGFELVGGAP